MLAVEGIEMTDVWKSLDYGLKILRNFERISLISRKAGHCMLEFPGAFDSLRATRKYTYPDTGFQLPLTDILKCWIESEQRLSPLTSETSWTIPKD
jgi:hypothetical protein